MKKYTTSERLKQIMSERNIKQIDILELVLPICKKYGMKMNRSDISQYVSGKVEPNQRKLVVLAQALNVSETWLMGYENDNKKAESYGSMIAGLIRDTETMDIIADYEKLQQPERKQVADYIKFLLNQRDNKEGN